MKFPWSRRTKITRKILNHFNVIIWGWLLRKSAEGGGDGFWRTEFQSRGFRRASFGDNRLNPKGGLRYTIEVQRPHFVFPLTRSATPPGRQLCVPVLRFGAKSGTCTGVFQYSFPGFRPVAVEVESWYAPKTSALNILFDWWRLDINRIKTLY